MREVYIIGAYMTKFGKHYDLGIRQLVSEALIGSLKDASLELGEIESIAFANSLAGYYFDQHMIRGNVYLRDTGISNIPITNLESACASGFLSFFNAYKDILTGIYDCTMAVGVEKMTTNDRDKMIKAFDSALDIEKYDLQVKLWTDLISKEELPDDITVGKRGSVFMDIGAALAILHMKKYGTTQKQLAYIASKNHCNGHLNPKAQYQFKLTTEEALNDYVVSYPLTRSMCSPIGDGCATAILCSGDYLKKLNQNVKSRAVRIRACVFFSGRDKKIEEPLIFERAALKLYEIGNIEPEDVDVAEVHDDTAFAELSKYEALGFCNKGEGGRFAEDGNTQINGKKPVNTSGGLLSKGHPIGATGLAQIYEITTQLRGEAGKRQVKKARIGLTENTGGLIGLEEASSGLALLEKMCNCPG